MNTSEMQKREQISCPVCSKQNYEWGKLFEMQFVHIDSPGFSKIFSGGGDFKNARRCKMCGNIQIFE